nr:Rac GTPase activating protein 1 [Hymenolepis microstoma]
MGRVKHERKISDRKLCSDTLANAVFTSSKLLDSADISDMMSKSIFLFYQKNTGKLIKEAKCLQSQKKELIRELFAANEKLEKAEEINRKLTSEAERLRMNLETIRDVLKDSDIDKVKERLAQLEDNSWMHTPTSNRSRCRVQHSAGSLLDSENTSSGGSDAENQVPNGLLPIRRSVRLSKGVDIPYIDSPKTPSRKRPTLDDAEGYHDVSFKKLAIDQTNMEDNGHGSDDSYSVKCRSGAFQTPEPPKQKVFTENRLTRLHDFHPISSLRLGICSCCGKRFTFGRPALRCRICRLVVHVQCQHQLKQRCVPPADLPPFNSPKTPNAAFNSPMTPLTLHRLRGGGGPSPLPPTTPSSTLRRQLYPWHTLSLDALCPTNESPRIPAAVILCVNEVASRGFIQLGIYRVPGGEKKVQDLLDKFLYSRTTPSLALVEDIHVVCSCLKAFLRLLDEPLVTLRLRPQFVAAGELFNTDPESAKYRAAELIERLPVANRDTLAFLLLHLKGVARSKACKMGEANLAKVFGLTIVGHSSVEPPLALASSEIQSQQATVRLLMAVPDAVYSTIVG